MRTIRTKNTPSFYPEQSTMVMKPNRHCGNELDNHGGVETIILTMYSQRISAFFLILFYAFEVRRSTF